ncbi:protein translocase subunit secG [Paraperlucidibaca baekdonensis]|uniref:Protein-export membrane protein SecG n=1 Tax=Paraperlucidibaca baekdonensis TaxID=748120 RepID=A0A3E0H8D4_9GAMM|nr:preprotein translocase subunit SecG [Paraperlucidibaca baekdonensis]REH39843.1 protein translocase subunit secG [Paraperlucidibaca baekdonensis]
METLVLVVHIIVAVVMIGLILLQQGKGAEMGASFGAGSSGTVFGSSGSTGFLTKLTAALALVFFVTSLGLAIYAKNQSRALATSLAPNSQAIPGLPELPVQQAPAAPANPDLPVAPAQ